LGERVHVCNDVANIEQGIRESPARFVLVGVPEEIGNKANLGKGGTDTAWFPFSNRF
jgi:formiminoglutamase